MRSIAEKTTYYYAFIVLFSGVTREVGGALHKPSTQVVTEREETTEGSMKRLLCINNIINTKTKKQTVHSANSSLEPWKFGKPRKRRRAPTISKRDTSPDDYTDSSWPSFYDILERVHRNMTHVKRDEFFNYAWSPYALTYSSKHLAPTMKPPQPPSPPPLSNKAHRSNQTDLFVYRKVYAFNRSILAVSIRRTTTPSGVDTLKAEPAMTASTPVPDMAPVGNSTHSRHFKKPQEHFRALSAARARLHHRWLQKGNFKAKILT